MSSRRKPLQAGANPRETDSDVVVGRGVKIAAEVLVTPGSSLLLDGNVASGGLHVVGGLLARWALGPVGWVLVAADSYARSVTGKGLPEILVGSGRERSGDAAE
jgi:hypothetical protein